MAHVMFHITLSHITIHRSSAAMEHSRQPEPIIISPDGSRLPYIDQLLSREHPYFAIYSTASLPTRVEPIDHTYKLGLVSKTLFDMYSLLCNNDVDVISAQRSLNLAIAVIGHNRVISFCHS